MFAALLSLPLWGQTSQTTGTLAGAGYRNASPVIEAAPGQVLIVSLYGAKARLTEPVYGKPVPPNLLATTVGGFSAQLVQSQTRTSVGIYGVTQSGCPGSAIPCQPVTNLTLQVPFQLLTSLASNSYAGLEFKEGDTVLMQFPILPVSDKVHVINSCDESLIYYSVFGSEDACTSAVVRPRGGLITPRNPVHPGEPLVAFAYGMGDATPSPVSVPFQAGLTKQPFILRYAGAGGPAYWAQAPDGVSLTTSNGTYEIHFTVPPLPDSPLPPCGQGGIYGNMKVSVSGTHSSDTFDLCVTP